MGLGDLSNLVRPTPTGGFGPKSDDIDPQRGPVHRSSRPCSVPDVSLVGAACGLSADARREVGHQPKAGARSDLDLRPKSEIPKFDDSRSVGTRSGVAAELLLSNSATTNQHPLMFVINITVARLGRAGNNQPHTSPIQ